MTEALPQPPLFHPGQIVATPGALELANEQNINLGHYLRRHLTGDFGEMNPEDIQLNRRALTDGSRIFSSYRMPDEESKLWIISEAEYARGRRPLTTILRPEDY